MLVIHTREGHRPDLADLPPAKKARGRSARPASAIPARWGASWCAANTATTSSTNSSRSAGEPVVDKPGKGAFYATDLDAILHSRGIAQLIVCGVTTEVCVNTTVREANDRGYDCLVAGGLRRLLLSRIPARWRLAMIKAQGGIFGWVGSRRPICRPR